ncbi:MFS transporter [Williamwhitmania taraxaci]|uniref:Predicted arabinose efflux permease, MFS family n=1 Tax=Williamwhitmania taraxaci TaxID=1640674 RepID=A0A1G6TML0_9BACT|nr:MFS transporter [Williamwhitmania taraxaci]SDD30422.1 Predicted arabinose efflux permease, MFS family [Williamwhitmania taraxaci]
MNRFLDIRSYFQGVGFAFRAMQSRNFKLFFYGQIVSLIGTWVQNIALGWLVYRLTNSVFLLGLVGFAGQIPSLLITPFAGVYADRLNRHKVMIITQMCSMVLAFSLAILVFTDSIQVWQILFLATLNGVVLAVDTPFRHAFLLVMVGDKSLLQNAIALNSTLINSARFIGPTIGGIIIALMGEAWCFLLNGVSFMAVIGALLAMRVDPFHYIVKESSIFHDLKEGFRYSFSFVPIRYLLILVGITGFFGLPFQVFLPVYAKDILGGGAELLGFLTGSMGAGALVGAFYLASRKTIATIPRLIMITAIIFAVTLMGFAYSRAIPLSIILMFFMGLGMILAFAATNTLLQTIVDEDKRGRVVSLYGMSFMGITPLGSLLLGSLSHRWGVQSVLFVSGFFCLLAAFLYARRIPLIQKVVDSVVKIT